MRGAASDQAVSQPASPPEHLPVRSAAPIIIYTTPLISKPSHNEDRPSMSERHYTVLFEPAEEGGYVATCPALPGLVTEGDTLDEAREMARDAIRGYLESLQKDGEPIPEDIKLAADPVKEELAVLLS
jgi:antitoxin HicB